MQRPIRWILWSFSGLLALLLLALMLLILACNSPFGRTSIERAVSILSGEQVILSGFGGDFPGELTIEHLELHDSGGIWLTIDGLMLNWLPIKLLAGGLAIERLQAQQVTLVRPPVTAAEPATSGNLSLPLSINLRRLMIGHFQIASPLGGQSIDLGIEGQLRLTAISRGEVELCVQSLKSEGTYRLQANLTDDMLDAHLSLHEAARGFLAMFAGLRNQGALNLEASLEGPLSSVNSHINLNVDALQALIDGKIDFLKPSVELVAKATASAMQLRSDLAWQALALNAQINGPLNTLNINGSLNLDKLTFAQVAVGATTIKLQGTNGRIDVDGTLAGLRLPDSQGDVLNGKPLAFQAKLGLDRPDHPVAFELKHPLIAVTGQANIKEGQSQAEVALTLPDLKPVAAMAGLGINGNGKLTLKYNRQDDDTRLEAAGILSISEKDSSWSKLLGKSAKFDLSMAMQGKDVAITGLHLNGKALTLSADGGLTSGNADFNWQAQLNDLSAITATGSGRLAAQGQLIGSLDDFKLSVDLNGELASKGYPSGPITANLQLKNLPHAPNGRINLAGVLLRDPIAVQLAVNSSDNKTIKMDIDKADWKSAHAQGGLMFTQDSPLPLGKIEMKIRRLADIQPLLDRPLSGSVNVTLESTRQSGRSQAMLSLAADNAVLDGTATIDRSNLELTVSDPMGLPKLNGLLALDGISVGNLNGSAQVKLDGSLDALGLRLSAFLPNLGGSDVQLDSDALLNLPAGVLMINALQTDWSGQAVRLLAPTKIGFSDGLTVDRARLGLQQAELELGGRFSPTLALTVKLHKTSAELLSLFAPNLAMTGTVHADAELNGSLQQPTGLVRINADQLQIQHGPGRALPPARLNAIAILHGDVADLDVGLNAGSGISLQVAGQAPITSAGLFDLHSEAALDLKQLDPILTANGRRLRGQLIMNSKLVGIGSLSSLSAHAQINNGEWRDYAAGTELSNITAELAAADGTLRLVKLQARAGHGTLTATGNIGLLSTGMPIDLTVTARNVRPLASDQLMANLDADIVLGGLAAEQMTVTGSVRINRAEIRIPERMPTSIAVLKLSHTSAEAATPQSPKENSDIGLNLTLAAPGKVFIRGRGLDAELGGNIHIKGTTNKPQPDGVFKLQRGQFTLAGQTLVFNQGSIDFDNNKLNNPSLNFVANSTRNNITASLVVTGSAQNPKITLSSTPTLPQDEILANLLFGKGTANLSPLEMVQIASTLASLTGVTTGIDDPLESARKLLGLDRLSVGGANPGLDAGRYIAPGVYLGAKQGISGGTPQATIQIEVSKRFKLEGGVGTGAASSSTPSTNSGSSSVGMIYQFEY
jgi:translocation and assembly module TamB